MVIHFQNEHNILLICRIDESDVVFRATTGKWRAVVVEISRMHKTGRPVLVGTTSVEQSDALSEQLHEDGIPHEVLNAKPENVEREAEIVAQSGRLGAVTIATNMAGRGTDIILGETISLANDAVELAVKSWGQRSLTELEAEERLSYSCEKGPTRDEVIAKLRDAFIKIVQEYKVYTDEERKKILPTNHQVVAAGGLHVVGTERHESRRIDNQLFEYDEVLNSQRDRVYAERRRALVSDNLQSLIVEYAELTMDDILEANISPDTPKENWDLEKLIAKVQQKSWRNKHQG
ncbi:translocase subunit SecA [Musa troglodytarum]|uniref:Translocase subunit SecA n=1 Tax=Musa troglodytarum TaxID=320322 RepID=A0A9E7EZ17_9LILI|nr:translocase subunit SecA [Musa troglodytarum]